MNRVITCSLQTWSAITIHIENFAFLCGYYVSTDIDECQGDNACHSEAQCHNEPGSYRCACKSGYEGDGWYCAGESYI